MGPGDVEGDEPMPCLPPTRSEWAALIEERDALKLQLSAWEPVVRAAQNLVDAEWRRPNGFSDPLIREIRLALESIGAKKRKCGPENYHCYNHDRADHGGHTVCCRCGERP